MTRYMRIPMTRGTLVRMLADAAMTNIALAGALALRFAADLAFLQDLYRRINQQGHTEADVRCPGCGREFSVDLAGDASGPF